MGIAIDKWQESMAAVYRLVACVVLLCVCVAATEDWFVGPNTNYDHCTTITVGRAASSDGSTMTTHTNDCHDCDTRVFRVPAQDHPEGSMRPVYMAERGEYPRYVGKSRGPGYHRHGDQVEDVPMGEIPQVPHTYAYFDGTYGLMNEWQVAIGESTCSGKIWAKPISAGGHALFDITELSHIALERAQTAREALEVITSLADKYGFYTMWEPVWEQQSQAGETLTIIDPDEAWVLNMLASPDGKSAVWAAKRVPDDEIAVTANFFTIGQVDENSTEWYMLSANAKQVAQEKGFWDPAVEPFNFVKAFAPIKEDRRDKDYWIVRMWRVFDMIAPSLGLRPDGDSVLDYPFSVKPDKLVTAHDVMRLNRDLYEGTEYDLTTGASAGPFGSPLRQDGWSPSARKENITGEWARAISIMRTAYSTVAQSRNWLPNAIGGVLWLGQDAPHSTVYVPFYSGSSDTPKSYRTGSLHKFTRDCAWWAFDFVSNWAEYKWKYIMSDVRKEQQRLELDEFARMKAFEEEVMALYQRGHYDEVIEKVTQFTRENGESIVSQWWDLSDHLIAKYNDGYVNFPKVGGMAGYPKWWLESVGYDMDPRYKVFVKATHEIGKANSTASHPLLASSLPISGGHFSQLAFFSFLVFSAVISVAIGFAVGRRGVKMHTSRSPRVEHHMPLTPSYELVHSK